MTRTRSVRFRSGLHLEVLEGRDLPGFLAPLNYPIPSTQYGRQVVDVSQDGCADVVVAEYNLNAVAVFKGDCTGRLAAPVFYPTADEPVDLKVTDVNNDGKRDVVTLNDTYSSNPTIGILLGFGDGTFPKPLVIPAVSGNTHIAVGDLNRDGHADFATSNGAKNVVNVWRGNGDGTFQLPLAFPVGPAAWGVQVVDLNGDEWPDLCTVNPGAGQVNVLLNRGDGTFKPPVAYAAGNYPFVHDVGDIIDDGRPAVVVADFYGNTVNVFLSNPDGTLQPMIVLPSGPNPFDPRLGDFNRDGRVDVAAAHYGTSTVGVFLNNGSGTFLPHVDFGVGKTDFRALAVGDLNNDRFTDAVVPTGHGAGGYLNVLRNDANWPAPLPPFGPSRVAISAANAAPVTRLSARTPSLVVATEATGSVEALSAVAETLQPRVDYPTHEIPGDPVVADFNRDRKLDVATTSNANQGVAVLLGKGDGTFAPKVVLPLDDHQQFGAPAAGDLNNDRFPDLIVGGTKHQKTWVFMNDGNWPAPIPPPPGPRGSDGVERLQSGSEQLVDRTTAIAPQPANELAETPVKRISAPKQRALHVTTMEVALPLEVIDEPFSL